MAALVDIRYALMYDDKPLGNAGKNMRLKITELRKKKGMSQAELARRLGIAPPTMHQIEKGIRNMTVERQAQIASALGVPPTELVDFAGSDEDRDAILEAYDLASPAERAMILSMARAILDQQ